MNNASLETRTVTVERDFAHPPEKIWRALTEPHLIEAWPTFMAQLDKVLSSED